MKLSGRYYTSPTIVLRREASEGFLFNSANGSLETINETGIYIYKLCNGKNRLDDIINKALKKYSGNKDSIRKEIKVFMNKLIKDKYIKVEK